MARPAPLPSSRLLLSACPCRLPHVRIVDGEVFFGALRDPGVGEAEREFLELADGRTPFADILGQRPWLMAAAGMSRHAVWLPSALEPQAAAGPRCLVLGAHPGDAELSMGGFLLNRRGAARFTLLNLFSRQIETRVPDAFGSRVQVTAVRRDESALAAIMTRIETLHRDLPEYVLRQTGNEDERMPMPGQDVETAVRIALYDAMAELAPEHVYAPAAIGNHPDQRLLFDAVLELFEEDCFPGVSYHLYENVPLAASYLNVDDFLSRFEGSYLDPEPWFEDVTGVLAEKLTLLEIFRSRLDLASRRLLLEIARRNARLERHGLARHSDAGMDAGLERFWTLREVALYK